MIKDKIVDKMVKNKMRGSNLNEEYVLIIEFFFSESPHYSKNLSE